MRLHKHLLCNRLFLVAAILLLVAAGCKDTRKPKATVEGRWFTQSQYELGKITFAEHCAACHGQYAQGMAGDWRTPNADGSFPPPPLDGSAHAWHHSFDILMKTINQGGAPLGGKMPAFGSRLTEEEKIAVIAYFQSMWDTKTYNRWVDMNSKQ